MSIQSRHRVVALAFPEVVAFDLSTAAQIFGYRGEHHYSLVVAALHAGKVTTSTGFSIDGVVGPQALREADTIIVPGFTSAVDATARHTSDALDELRAAHHRGTRIVSICTGAFALAAAGLLDGRAATTHWLRTEELSRDYPLINVDPGVLYLDHGDIATSAGVAAGIDLCLHLVRGDCGEDAAASIARRMVVAPHRRGGQAQFIDHPGPDKDVRFGEVTEWMLSQLSTPLTVADCAIHASMSVRNFQRRFTEQVGIPPVQWLTHQRVLAARRLLERTELTVDAIASRCGLGTSANLRRHCQRELGVTPSAYRRAFAGR